MQSESAHLAIHYVYYYSTGKMACLVFAHVRIERVICIMNACIIMCDGMRSTQPNMCAKRDCADELCVT